MCKSYLIVLLVSFVAIGATMPEDFSGEWALNEQKSNFGTSNFRMGATTMKVKQEDVAITIARNGTVPNGEAYAWEEKLTADGKETETTVFGTGKRKASLKWSDDSKSFTVSSKTLLERDGNSIDITSTEIFKLSDGGKTLTVDVNSTSSFGTFTRILVYDKK
jgi:hypothetical protein